MQLDFEKAFDSIEWNFMFEVLRKLKLGAHFISLVECCYNNIYSCVTNNGFTSNWFRLNRGVRQGCLLSCLLFILCVEIMGNKIRNNSMIKGLKVFKFEHKIKQFADDCTCYVASRYSLIETIKGFLLCSGLKLNTEKSLLFFLGPWKNRTIGDLDMKIERFTTSILDVGVGLNEIEKHNIIFESKLPTIINLLQMYSHRDLSVCGKIVITKTFGISKILHQLSVIDVTKSFLDRLQSELNKYICGYKPAEVKQHVLIGENIQGGGGFILLS